MIQDLFFVLNFWFFLSLWQLVSIPFLVVFFKQHLADSAWAFGRLSVWLTIGLVIWFLAHLGLPVNSRLFIWLLFLGLAFLSHHLFTKNRLQVSEFIKKNKLIILTEELLFALLLFFLCWVRGFNPKILDLEKFMDAGFVVSYSKSPKLPITDMWLAGQKVNYYTFGHFLGAVVMQYFGSPIDKTYNLLLGLIMGLVGAQAASLIINLVLAVTNPQTKQQGKLVVGSGLLAALLVTLGGNSHTAWYFLKNFTFKGYWYPDATRFIYHTIHEFPAYSFIVSDLHAHVWNMPIVLLTLLTMFVWLNQLFKKDAKYLPWAVLVGSLLGVMVATSTWDAAVYSLLLVVVAIISLLFDVKYFLKFLFSAIVMIVSAIFVSSPWWINFKSISDTINLVTQRTPWWELLVLWLGHGLLSAIGALTAIRLLQLTKVDKSIQKQQPTMVAAAVMIVSLVVAAFTLLLIPEFIYVKDIYTDHPRANTMFKLTFQAFMMMSLVVAWMGAYFSRYSLLKIKSNQIGLQLIKLLILFFVICVGVYPYFGYRDYYQWKQYQGLDGLSWLEKEAPTDYQAIQWMNRYFTGRPVIVEAAGDSYTTFARVSVFTGFPTVVGWKVHEWLWRGGYQIPGERATHVQSIYENPLGTNTQAFLKQYEVQYIFVGNKEREAYTRIDENGLQSLGQTVFRQGSTYIIKVDNGLDS